MSSASSIDSKKKDALVSESPKYDEKSVGEYRVAYEGEFTEEQLAFIHEHLNDRTTDECLQILKDALEYHLNDPSLDVKYYEYLEHLVEGQAYDETLEEWEYRLKFETFLIYDWSIYPQVRSVTHPIDEPDEGPIETLRVYIISVVLSCAGSTLATFFEPRFPSISISSVALQVLMSWAGRASSVIPPYSIPLGFGRRLHLGGGKWTYKEQMLATCGMGVGDQSAYSQDAVLAMSNQYFYNFPEAQGNFGFAIMLTLSSNLMGFGLAGIFRVFLVYPARYIWWGVLPSIRLSRSLVVPEKKETINGWSISGAWVFWIAAISNFCWYWITNYVMIFFSYFNWITWINVNDNNLLVVTDVATGVGITPAGSLDPSLTGVGAMITPFYVTLLSWSGMLVSGLIVLGMFYMNVSYTGYLPVNDASLHDRFGNTFNVSMILDKSGTLVKEKYLEYGMPFWSAGNLVAYGAFFAFYPAMISYALLEYGQYMWEGCTTFFKIVFKKGKAMDMFTDRFSRAQRKYKEVPEWWYTLCLFGCIGMGIGTVEHYGFTHAPVWTIFFGIGLSAFFMIPCGVLFAVTNTGMAINVLYELVIGLAIPGNGTALMIAKTYATNFMSETDTFISNLKTGHYCGIPPRSMFRVQIVNMVCNSFVQAGLTTWQSTPGSIPNMCSPANRDTNKFVCMNTRIYFNAAVQWGTIGPARILRDLYPRMRYAFLFGACLPVPFWLIRHFLLAYARRHNWGRVKEGAGKFRNLWIVRDFLSLEWTTSINEIVFLTGCLNWGSTSLGYYTTTVYLGWVFAYYLPKHYPKWWAKYNYLIYAGTTVGVSISAIVVFFALQYHNIPDFYWWGNYGATNLQAAPNLEAGPDGFGPKWRW